MSRNPRRTCARTLRPRRPRSCASYLSQPCAAACAAPSQPATLPGDSWLERHYSDQGGLPWIRPNPLRVVGFGEGLLDRRGRQAEDGHTTPSLGCRGFGRPALLLSLAAAAVAPSRLTTLPILSAGKLLFVDGLLCDTPTTPDFELWTRPRGPLHYQRPSGVAARPDAGRRLPRHPARRFRSPRRGSCSRAARSSTGQVLGRTRGQGPRAARPQEHESGPPGASATAREFVRKHDAFVDFVPSVEARLNRVRQTTGLPGAVVFGTRGDGAHECLPGLASFFQV